MLRFSSVFFPLSKIQLSEEKQREYVRSVSGQYNATIAMWGEGYDFGVEIFYEISPKDDQYVNTLIDSNEFFPQTANLNEFSTYLLNGMDTHYIFNFTLAQIHYFEDDYKSAFAFFNEAEDLIPDGSEDELRANALFFYRGYIKQKQNDNVGAIEDYDKAINLDHLLTEAYNNRGVAKVHLGDALGATKDYDLSISLNPNDTRAYNNRGVAKADLGDSVGAIEDFNTAIQLDPEYAVAYYNRGNTKYDLDDHVGAIEDYNKAIELNPDYIVAYINRGVINILESKMTDRSLLIQIQNDLTKAITLGNNTAYQLRGSVNVFLGDHEQALSDFEAYEELVGEVDPSVVPLRTLAEANVNGIELSPADALTRGNAKAHSDDYQDAIEDYNKAIEFDPDFADAYITRGFAKYHQGDYRGAIEDYDTAININPDDALAYNYRGLAKYSLEDYEGAVEDYNRAIERDLYFPEPYSHRGTVYVIQFQSNTDNSLLLLAYSDFTQAVALGYDTAYPLRGSVNFLLRNYKQAIADFEAYENIYGEIAPRFLEIKIQAQQRLSTEEAEDNYGQTGSNQVIDIDEDYALAYYNLGNTSSEIGDLEDAIEFYSQAIDIDPSFVESLSNRGSAKYELNDLIGAMEDYDQAIILDPNYSLAYSGRSHVKYDLGDITGAIEDCEQAIYLDPDNTNAYMYCGIARIQQSDFEQALQDFNKAVDLSPDDADAYNRRALVKTYLNDFEGALNDMDEAIRLAPNDYILYNSRGVVRGQSQDYLGAIEDFSDAIRLNPYDDSAYSNRAFANILLENYSAALADYETFVELVGEDNIPEEIQDNIDRLEDQLGGGN